MRFRPVKNRVDERNLARIRRDEKVRRLRKKIRALEEAKQGDREHGGKIHSTFFHSCSGTKHGFKDRPSSKKILQKPLQLTRSGDRGGMRATGRRRSQARLPPLLPEGFIHKAEKSGYRATASAYIPRDTGWKPMLLCSPAC